MARLVGVAAPPVVRITGTGAFARRRASGREEILLGAEWVTLYLDALCDDGACDDGLLAYVAAHELAHLLLWHVRREVLVGPLSRAQEAEADFVAGWLLRRRGYPGTAVDEFLYQLSPHCGEHPAAPQRVVAASAGWQLGQHTLPVALHHYRPTLVAMTQVCAMNPFA